MRSWPVVIAAGVLIVGGCSGGVDADGPLALYSADADPVGLQALLPDAVVELSDGCLMLRPADGMPTVPVFRSSDATWDDGALTFRGQRYEVGDAFTVDGGYSGTVAERSADVLTPAGCDPQAALWLVGDYTGPWPTTPPDT